jgi:hypothetical protein
MTTWRKAPGDSRSVICNVGVDISASPAESRELSSDERLIIGQVHAGMTELDNTRLRHRIASVKIRLGRLSRDQRRTRQLGQGLDDFIAAERTAPPALGHKLACFLVPMGRQEEVIGDLDERFNTRWLCTLGPCAARWCYVWHLFRISLTLARVAVLGALGTFIWKFLRGG